MKASSPRYSAPALEKGLDILELLAATADGLSQSAIAEGLGRSTGEIFRMLTILEQRGYLQRGPADELYRLTPRLFELAHHHPPSQRLLQAALPQMQRLAAAAAQSCHLAIRHQGDALIVAQVDGPGFLGFAVRPGARIALVDSCSGRVLLAFQQDWRRQDWLQECAVDHSENLRRALAHIRRAGAARRKSTQTKGVTDLSAPVLDHSGEAVASLTVPYLRSLASGPDEAQVIQLLRGAADRISAALGGASNPPSA